MVAKEFWNNRHLMSAIMRKICLKLEQEDAEYLQDLMEAYKDYKLKHPEG